MKEETDRGRVKAKPSEPKRPKVSLRLMLARDKSTYSPLNTTAAYGPSAWAFSVNSLSPRGLRMVSR